MVGEAAFQAAPCLLLSFAAGDLGVVVGPSSTAAHAYLAHGDDVQGVVELPVTAERHAMPDSFCAGNLDRGDAGVAGKGGCGCESAHATGACQQPAGDHRPNTVDLDQLAAGRVDRLGDLSGENLQPLVCLANL